MNNEQDDTIDQISLSIAGLIVVCQEMHNQISIIIEKHNDTVAAFRDLDQKMSNLNVDVYNKLKEYRDEYSSVYTFVCPTCTRIRKQAGPHNPPICCGIPMGL